MTVREFNNVVMNRISFPRVSSHREPFVQLIDCEFVDNSARKINLPYHASRPSCSPKQHHQKMTVAQKFNGLCRPQVGIEIVVPDQIALRIERHYPQQISR